jgi:ubiquinone/menaquinone biosynthesis C-methylase UbiE
MNKKHVEQTFDCRANKYDDESAWVNDEVIIQLFVPNLFGDGTLVDLCSGTGSISKYAVLKGWEVTAVDISEPMLNQIRDESIKKLLCDAENLPFEDNRFEIVTCRQGLHYLDLPHALVEFDRVAKSEIRLGHITLEESEDEGWWREYFKIASPGRRHIFHPGQIGEICKKCGFSIIEQKVFRTLGSFNGPIAHLSESKRKAIYKLVDNAPIDFKQRYSMKPNGNDIIYSYRWEFYIIGVSK